MSEHKLYFITGDLTCNFHQLLYILVFLALMGQNDAQNAIFKNNLIKIRNSFCQNSLQNTVLFNKQVVNVYQLAVCVSIYVLTSC